tara:strand:- start:47 stop:304 length:258 start_codon:yes stop_codon:yes gene_type:complete
MKKKKLKKIDRFWHGVFSFAIVIVVLLTSVRCEYEYAIGKTHEEIAREMFEVDSLIKTIQMQIDSTNIDFEKFYLDAQRINNGHE